MTHQEKSPESKAVASLSAVMAEIVTYVSDGLKRKHAGEAFFFDGGMVNAKFSDAAYRTLSAYREALGNRYVETLGSMRVFFPDGTLDAETQAVIDNSRTSSAPQTVVEDKSSHTFPLTDAKGTE